MPFIRNEHGYKASSVQLLAMLGLTSVPIEGFDARLIQGIKVWAKPLLGYSRHKRSTHRVLAECPTCGKHLSVGRLHQHKCKQVKS